MHDARVVPLSGPLALESETSMAAKCAYVEKVGAVYYVRKRIPRAWNRQSEDEVVRMSLRTKDRVTAIKRGLEALAVFEELLRMEPKDALMHLTRRLIDEQMLRPEAMTGEDLTRRRALESVGAKIIKRARQELDLGENLDGIYQELVHFNRATVEGEAIYDRLPAEEKAQRSGSGRALDLSGFDEVMEALGAAKTEAPTTNAVNISAHTPVAAPAPRPEPVLRSDPTPAAAGAKVSASATYTLRYLMEDYFKRDGKKTGSDNRTNVERAVKLFEDLCPEVKTLAVMGLRLTAYLGGHKTVIFDTDIEGDSGQQSCMRWAKLRGANGVVVRRARLDRIGEAILWAERNGFTFIVIDTPGRDMAGMKQALNLADFMLTPSQPSPLDLQATEPIRRLWAVSSTPSSIALNMVIRDTLPRTRNYVARYAEQGAVLPAFVGRRVQYLDAMERGLGVSEYMPGDIGDREMRQLLTAIFAEAEKRNAA